MKTFNYWIEVAHVLSAILLAVGVMSIALHFTTDLHVVRIFWIASSVLHVFFILPMMFRQLMRDSDYELKRWRFGFLIAGIGQALVSVGGIRFYFLVSELRDKTELYLAAFIWLIVTIGIAYAYWPRRQE